jgi:heat shock protein HslJ
MRRLRIGIKATVNKSMKQIFLILYLWTGLLILAGCATLTAQQGTQRDLTGTIWNLSSFFGKELVPGSGITVEFTSDGKIGGSSGCNRYVGTYKADGNSLLISSPLASTMMACSQEIMAQETAYLQALGEVRSFTVARDQLTLEAAGGKGLMVFNAQTQELAGTSWEVTGYNNGQQAVTTVLAGTTITAEFGKDGTLSGNSSCNDYSGPYTVTGNQIEVGPLASTKKACADPAGVMEQETQYLVALETAATYRIEGKVLELRTADGALAVKYTIK